MGIHDGMRRDSASIHRLQGQEDVLHLPRGQGPGTPIRIRILRRVAEDFDTGRGKAATVWVLRPEAGGTIVTADDQFMIAEQFGEELRLCRVTEFDLTTALETKLVVVW